jgi:hypothetical protein
MTGDVKSLLVSRARDTAEQIAKADPSAVRELVRLLEERPWHVFHRLALHLLRLFPEAAPELIIAHLTDRALFEVLGPSHEYALLAGVHFGNLDDAARARVLTWIADGPTHEGIAALEGHHAVRYAKRWRRDHLAPISAHLPAPWRNLYEGLNLELGPPNGENGELELRARPAQYRLIASGQWAWRRSQHMSRHGSHRGRGWVWARPGRARRRTDAACDCGT